MKWNSELAGLQIEQGDVRRTPSGRHGGERRIRIRPVGLAAHPAGCPIVERAFGAAKVVGGIALERRSFSPTSPSPSVIES